LPETFLTKISIGTGNSADPVSNIKDKGAPQVPGGILWRPFLRE